MLQKMKKGVVAFVGLLGYEMHRKSTVPAERELTAFESCLHLLMSMREKLNIVQVGANDGAINDPLYRFILTYPRRTQIILVEPQSYLISELEKNYEFQNAKYIFNGAVGPERSLRLYRVMRDSWKDLSVPYAKDWPEYRAPTGVTSASYDHVHAWVAKNYKGGLRPQDVIEAVSVDCVNMGQLLQRADLFESIDILQIDTEGFDDQVIYASDIETFRPLIVNFEYGHLSSERANELREYLRKHGYVFSQHGFDGLAIRVVA